MLTHLSGLSCDKRPLPSRTPISLGEENSFKLSPEPSWLICDSLQVGKKKPASQFKKAGKLVGPLTTGWDTFERTCSGPYGVLLFHEFCNFNPVLILDWLY